MKVNLGRRQAVSHRFLVSAFAGSNPADPELIFNLNDKNNYKLKDLDYDCL